VNEAKNFQNRKAMNEETTNKNSNNIGMEHEPMLAGEANSYLKFERWKKLYS